MFKEEKSIRGLYDIIYLDDDNKPCASIESENLVTNEGISLLVKALLTNDMNGIEWYFRVGTGNDFTNPTMTYNSIDSTIDKSLVEAGVGSVFYNEQNQIITLNGIVLSDQGYVKTIRYEEEEQPRENTVTTGYKFKDTHQEFANSLNTIGDTREKLFLAASTSSKLDLIKILPSFFKKPTEKVNIHVVSVGGWLNDINEEEKWNNVALIAKMGKERYLFSRTVLPPFFKAQGVRMCIKYTLIL